MSKHNILLVLFFLICLGNLSLSQCDTNKLNSLTQKILELCYTYPEKALKEANQLQIKAKECGLPIYEVRAIIRKGIANDVKSDLVQSIAEYQHALLLSKKIDYQKGIASCENNLGLVYWKQNDLKRAIIYLHKAKLSFEKMEDYSNTGTTLNNLGLIYAELEKQDKAISLYHDAIRYYKLARDEYAILNTYSNLGISHESKENKDSSIYYSKLAIAGYEKNKNYYGISMSLSNLGLAYKSEKKYKEAEACFHRAAKLSQEIGNEYSYVSALINLADTYEKMNNRKQVISVAKIALPIAQRLNAQEQIYKAALILTHVYFDLNDVKQAKYYFNIYLAANRKYTEEILDKTIDRTNALYDIESAKQKMAMVQKQKDLEIDKIQSEKKLYTYLWIGSILILLALILVFVLNGRRTALKKELLAQKRVYEATNEERKRISYDLHDMVGSQLSFVVNNLELLELELPQNERVGKTFQMGQEAMASLRDTVWALHAEEPDVDLLVERMQAIAKKWLEENGVRVSFLIHKENHTVNSGEALHILRVYQEIVTNIYKHAQASEVNINLSWNKDSLILEVKDNGLGFETGNEFINHYGIESMKQRALKIGANLTIHSVKNKGTQVELNWKNTTIA